MGKRDSGFKHWSSQFKISKIFIQIIATIFSFKFAKMYYSRFFGFSHFNAQFDNIDKFHTPQDCMTFFNIIFTLFPIIFVDIIGFITLSWGNQLYITIIESLLLGLFIMILSIIEFRTAKMKPDNTDGYQKLKGKGDDD